MNVKGVSLFHEPFTHCVINDLVSDTGFVNDLNNQILEKLKYREKNNDLYKFHQVIVYFIFSSVHNVNALV
jgi:hypothetical protein